MSGTSIVFVVPSTYQDLVEIISQQYGTITGMPNGLIEDRAAVASHLSTRVGMLAEIEFDDDFSDNPVLDVAAALDRHDVAYIGYWPAHEERSRGDRFDGGYVVRFPDAPAAVTKHLPWSKGDPTPLDQDMRAAGFSDAELARIAETFYPGTDPHPAF